MKKKYSHDNFHRYKQDAQTRASYLRSTGKSVTTIKTGGLWRVYARSK